MHSASSFSSSTRPLASSAVHTTVYAMGVAGLQAAEVGGVGARLPALQRQPRARRLLRLPVPPWFLGTMGSTSRARG